MINFVHQQVAGCGKHDFNYSRSETKCELSLQSLNGPELAVVESRRWIGQLRVYSAECDKERLRWPGSMAPNFAAAMSALSPDSSPRRLVSQLILAAVIAAAIWAPAI